MIVHECVHLCEEDTNPDCDCMKQVCCWEEQRMVESAFQWALAQRYPCLIDAPHCGMGDDATFASSCSYAGYIQ